jgi:aminopeptidase-like protein
MNVKEEMYSWAKDLWPITRSLTGDGVRETLSYLKQLLPNLEVHSVQSGSRAFDWTVPNEWNIRDAYIEDESGNKIVNFLDNNLHVVGYSGPIDTWIDLEELDKHLHSLVDQPDAIPYITSYYSKYWGFCLKHSLRQKLKKGLYHVVIDSDLKPGVLNYGELVIPGDRDEEVFLSTYICHPSMANNELSGIVVTTALTRFLLSLKELKYTYRIIFIPETIGSIVYLSKNIEHLRKKVLAGFQITCVGDERCYSYLPSRLGETLSDDVALHVLKHTDKNFKKYTWLERGSDERQYCAPGVDLPVASIMRSKYEEYPEYHTSLDDLNFVTQKGLEGGLLALKRSINVIEENGYFKTTVLCEPQLGKRDLYPSIGDRSIGDQTLLMVNLISYCDGNHSLLEISEILDAPFWKLIKIVERLVKHKLLIKISK